MEDKELPFESLTNADMAISDVNDDQNPDVIITGRNKETDKTTTKLYTSDGQGNFSVVNETSFLEKPNGSVTFANINGDDYPDLIITGGIFHTKLYMNDGKGNFSEAVDTPLEGVNHGSVMVKDVNHDHYPDILITGNSGVPIIDGRTRNDLSRISKLYINNGQGHFYEKENTPFIAVDKGEVEIEDFNGDGFSDIVLMGSVYKKGVIARLYINDGAGNFREKEDALLNGLPNGSIDAGDVNGDGFPDILISGGSISGKAKSSLYINDGTGRFLEKVAAPFVGIKKGSTLIKDINGDMHLDVVLMGRALYHKSMRLYINDGMGHFSERKESPFTGIGLGSNFINDFNNDGKEDIFLSGRTNQSFKYSEIYLGDGSGQFKIHSDSMIIGFTYSSTATDEIDHNSSAINDVNGDGYTDIFITGCDAKGTPTSKLYLNNGEGLFNELIHTSFVGVHMGDVSLADVNGDSHTDIFICGKDAKGVPVSKLYLNDGAKSFHEFTQDSLAGVYRGNVTIEDVNGDAYPDIFLCGRDHSNKSIIKIYLNDGSGHFIESKSLPFEVGKSRLIYLQDFDNDNMLDVFIAGNLYSKSKLYLNDGLGSFRLVMDTSFKNFATRNAAITDLNNDDLPDILLSGYAPFKPYEIKQFINQGSGNFLEIKKLPFEVIDGWPNFTIADVNGDKHPDVFLTGVSAESGSKVAKLYSNDGNGIFKEVTNTKFEGISFGEVLIKDIDNNQRPDILITGYNGSKYVTRLYINNGSID